MPSARTDTPPVSTSAKLIDANGNATTYLKRFLDVLWTRTGGFHDLSAMVSDLSTDVVDLTTTVTSLPSASAPQNYFRISNDLGVTWSPVSTTASLTAYFFDTTGATVATRATTGTCDDVTGFWTLTAGATTGLATTVAYTTGNGTEQIVAAIVSLGGTQTTLTFTSELDTTALGGFDGGGISK